MLIKNINKKYVFILYVLLISYMLIYLWEKSCMKYQINDDFHLAALCSGLYGENIPYTVFTNVIYGFILSILYAALPICNWLTVLNILVLYLIYAVLGYFLIKKNTPIVGLCCSALLLFSTYSSLLLEMNWTKFCAFFGMAGFIILAESLEEEQRKYRVAGIVVGEALILWSSIIRIQAFLLIVPFGFLLKVREIKSIKGIMQVLKDKYYKIVFASLIGVGLLLGVNKIAYSTEMWNDYRVFDILDYEFPQYEDYSEEYEKMGYTESDINFLKRFYISDSIVFDKDRVDRMGDLTKTKPNESMRDLLEELIQSLEDTYLSGHMASIAILLLVYFFAGEKRNTLLACLVGCLALMEIIVLHIMGRPIERVISIPIFSSVLCCLLMLNKENYVCNTKKYFLALTVYCLLFSKIFFLDTEEYCVGRTETVNFLEYISEQKESLFVWDIYDSRVMEAYNPLGRIDKDLMVNSTYDSGWPSNMPFFQQRYKEYAGGDSLYHAMVNADNVYLVGNNNIELKREFIENHYGDNVSYSLVESPYGFEVYSVNPYFNSDKSEDIQWDIGETTLFDEDLFIIKGTVSSEINNVGYLNLSDSEKKYTYQIKIQDGEFWVGIPYSDWDNGEELKVDFLLNDQGELKRSNLQYSICVPAIQNF